MPEEENKKREVLKKIAQSYPVATASQIGIQTNLRAKELGKILRELEREECIQNEEGDFFVLRPTEKGKKIIGEEEE